MSSFIFKINNADKTIAQAQAIQALGARAQPDVRMNPILLKPIGNFESEIYLLGEFFSRMNAREYYKNFVLQKGFKLALNAFKSLRKENDIILLEGAGSPAEINIIKYDIANMLLAKKVKAPVILVSDIERGGCFASILGTLLLLKPKYRETIKGIIINKFLGDKQILMQGVKRIELETGKPVLGIIPKINHNIPEEDALDGHRKRSNAKPSKNSDAIDTEIDKVSNAIESAIDIDRILKKILK
jgi:adenosylcobyric acid synthase